MNELAAALGERRAMRAEAQEGKRRRALCLLRDGETVTAVAARLKVGEQTVRAWKREAGGAS